MKVFYFALKTASNSQNALRWEGGVCVVLRAKSYYIYFIEAVMVNDKQKSEPNDKDWVRNIWNSEITCQEAKLWAVEFVLKMG